MLTKRVMHSKFTPPPTPPKNSNGEGRCTGPGSALAASLSNNQILSRFSSEPVHANYAIFKAEHIQLLGW